MQPQIEYSQTESQKLEELKLLSQEYEALGLELKMHNMELTSDSEEEYCCVTGISEPQREAIMKEAIEREAG